MKVLAQTPSAVLLLRENTPITRAEATDFRSMRPLSEIVAEQKPYDDLLVSIHKLQAAKGELSWIGTLRAEAKEYNTRLEKVRGRI